MPSEPQFAALARATVETVAGWTDASRPVPPGLRPEWLRLLPHLLVDRPDRETYLGHLRDARRASGRVSELEGVAERADLPTDEVLRSGIVVLSDERLALLAVEPILLSSLAALIDELSVADGLGPVWWDAMARVGAAAYPTLPARPVAPKADGTGKDPAGTTTVPTPAAKNSRRLLAALPWAIAAAAVAFAVGVGAWDGAGGTDFELRTARAGVAKVTPRGGDNALAFEVTVTAERTGFATVVLLTPGRRPRVYPDYGQDEKRAGPTDPAADGPFEAPAGTTVVVVVTETPATDLVRRAAAGLTPDAATPDVVRGRILERLAAFGHRWAAVGSTVVTDPKP